MQAEGQYRTNAEKVGQFYVRNETGRAGAAVRADQLRRASGPEFTMRYNQYRSAQINASAASGLQFRPGHEGPGGGLRADDAAGDGLDYMGMSFQEKKAQQGIPAPVIFCFSLFVFS